MVTIFIKKYSTRRPITVNLEGWSGHDTAAEQLQRTQKSWPSRKFRFHADSTVYTQGPLRIVFDLTGKAIAGYSYDACLFAFAPPSEDYPSGRLVWNDTTYSVTTSGKHRWPCLRLAQGVVTSSVEQPCAWLPGEMETREIHAQWAQRAIVDNMPWSCDPQDLVREMKTWAYAERAAERAVQENIWKREQRAIAKRDRLIASGKHLRLVEVA